MDMVTPKGLGFLSYGGGGLRGTDGLPPTGLVSFFPYLQSHCFIAFDWFEGWSSLCFYCARGDRRGGNSEHEAGKRRGLD